MFIIASNVQPVFPKTPTYNFTTISSANTALDGSGTLTTLVTATNPEGIRIDALNVRPTGTCVASVLRIFIHDGTNARLFKEVALPVYTLTQTGTSDTSSATVYFNGVDNPQLVLPQNYSLRVTIGTGNFPGWTVIVMGGSLTA